MALRQRVALWTSLVAVLAAVTLVGGAQVAQSGEFNREEGPAGGGVHVFRPGWRSGDPDIWLRSVLGADTPRTAELRSSGTQLYMSDSLSCTVVGWRDLLDGGALPFERTDLDLCRG